MLVPAPEHAVPAGPLAVRWLAYEVPAVRAGANIESRIELMNAGTVSWPPPTENTTGILLSYHWLDRLGNPIVWEGHRTPLPERVDPGATVEIAARMRGPIPPGPYRLAWDLVSEGRCWFSEIANAPLTVDVDVAPRLTSPGIAVVVEQGPVDLLRRTDAALAAQESAVVESAAATAFLAAGCEPAPDWTRRLAEAHSEGYALVGGSVDVHGGTVRGRRTRAALRPWTPGFGRKPNWSRPLVCPSVTADVLHAAPWTTPVGGLPALDPDHLSEPWVCDGRIRVSVDARSVPPDDRRRG